MTDFEIAQVRFNAILARVLDEAGVIPRRDFAAAIFESAERQEGNVQAILRGQAQGMIDGLPPDLTVIEGGGDDSSRR